MILAMFQSSVIYFANPKRLFIIIGENLFDMLHLPTAVVLAYALFLTEISNMSRVSDGSTQNSSVLSFSTVKQRNIWNLSHPQTMRAGGS